MNHNSPHVTDVLQNTSSQVPAANPLFPLTPQAVSELFARVRESAD